MLSQPRSSRGASALSNLLLIALLAYGAFIAFQYVPQTLEARSVDTLLESLQRSHQSKPIANGQVAMDRVHNLLNVSQMEDLADAFSVQDKDGVISVSISYERELNLLYKVKPVHYQRSVTLY